MSEERIHRAVSDDGTEIAGRVHGQGPGLVLVHGGVGDGETSWRFLLPYLETRFTCFTMSLRGRGLSAENPDQSPERLESDVVAFVESIAEPVGLFGHSSGGALSLGAARSAGNVSAVTAYEPALVELATEEMVARWKDAFARARALAGQGRRAEAVMVAIEDVALANELEMEAFATSGAAEMLAPNVSTHLREVDGYLDYRILDDPDRLLAPILLLRGEETHPWYRGISDGIAARLPGSAAVRDVPGAGHMGPQIAPERVADAIVDYFAGAAA